MTDIIIVGAGGHAAEIAEYIACREGGGSKNDLRLVGLIDDDPDSYHGYQFGAPYLGAIASHQVSGDVRYVIGIANLKFRKKIVEEMLSAGAQFSSVIHPSSYVSPSSSLGDGVVIGPNANIGPNVCVGSYSLLNARCSLGHDTRVGDCNFISPNVCMSGFTVVGDNNLFGINAATVPGVKVGNNNKIAAGMVLNKDVGDNEVVFFRQREKVIAVPK